MISEPTWLDLGDSAKRRRSYFAPDHVREIRKVFMEENHPTALVRFQLTPMAAAYSSATGLTQEEENDLGLDDMAESIGATVGSMSPSRRAPTVIEEVMDYRRTYC